MTNYERDRDLNYQAIRWRQIEDFPQYEVSSNGLVRNIKTGYILDSCYENQKLYVRLYDRSKHSTRKKPLSKLVYEAFIGKPEHTYTIAYKDSDMLNNNFDNLSAVISGRRSQFRAKPVDEYSITGTWLMTWNSASNAARRYHIKPTGIYSCCHGRTLSAGNRVWRWHKEPLNKYKLPVIELTFPGEQFKRIPNTFAEVSNYGRVRDTRREGKFYKIRADGSIRIRTNGKMIQKRLHSLVAEAFLPNPNHYSRVMFKDNNRRNCRADNLIWLSDFFSDQMSHTDN